MNKLLLALIAFTLSITTKAQQGGGGNWNKGGGGPAIGHLYGKVLDASNKEAVEFASVALLAMNKDSAIAGCLVKANGDFSMDNLPMGMYRLRVGLIGYKKLEMKVTVNMKNPEKDMGNLMLAPDAEVLNEVDVTAEKQAVQMSIDHKVYNVDKDISTRGGTGLDAVKNIPSVTVDADGNVALRNNSVQIYLDGRPTTLTLEQIPADQIDRIEIITNPSAKYDASTTGGILNVIMKHNTQPGYNGMIMGGIGTGDRYNGMGNINIKQGKFNFFGTYNYDTQTNKADGFTNRTNTKSDSDFVSGKKNKYFNETDTNVMKHNFTNVRAGFDYFLNNRNTITLTGNYVNGRFDGTDYQHFVYRNSIGDTNSKGYATNPRNTNFTNYTGMLQYKHTFPRAGEEFTTDITLNSGRSQTTYNENSYTFSPTGIEYPLSPLIQNSSTSTPNWMYTYQADFTNPINDSTKLEMGARSYMQSSTSTQNTTNIDPLSHEATNVYDLTNNYSISNLINAAYINYGSKLWGISYQAGLRFEETYFVGKVLNKETTFSYLYPDKKLNGLQNCFFPSLYISKKLPHDQEIQINFSRKINRPNFFQIAPIIFYSDNANIRIGNPDLGPEFLNIAEINYNIMVGKLNFLSSVYFRYSQNPITSVAYPETSAPGKPGDPNILINTFQNGKDKLVYGWDNTLKFTILKNLDVMANANPFYTSISWVDGKGKEISNSGYSWTGKGTVSYKFPANFTLQVNGTYQAPQIIPQGTQQKLEFMDVTLSKNIAKRLTLTLLLSDAFNSKRQGTTYITDTYMEDISRRRETRFLRFSASYIFGKPEALFKKKKQSKDQPAQEDMGF